MADQFKYQPEWQGPLSGRSFEKQTEDAINRALASGTANASDATPLQAGVASPGTSEEWSRGDHVHPPQTTLAGNAATATRLLNTRNITLNGDASGTAAFNGTGDATIGVTIPQATTAQKGLMSSADKTKLDSVEAGANNYTLPEATASTLGGVRVDTALNGSSTNPVRNSAVKGGMDGLQSQIDQTVKLSGSQTVAGAKTFTSPINGQLNGNATNATRLASGRYIGLSGAVTAQAQVFTGESDITIPISYLDATKLTGTAPVNTSGNAATATKLYTARDINVQDADGTNTGTAASFDGSGNAMLKLPSTIKANLTGNAASATKLATAQKLKTNLESTTDVTFDGSVSQESIPVTGILPIANGGTGSSTKNFVDITSNQNDIAGSKSFSSNMSIRNGWPHYLTFPSGYTFGGTLPTENIFSGLLMYDSTSTIMGSCESIVFPDGNTTCSLNTRGINQNANAGVSVEYQSSNDRGFRPNGDNVLLLGNGSNRWKNIYSASATINTSDERLKDCISEIPDEVLDAWKGVGFRQFRFFDAVAEKGAAARLHVGLIAQDIGRIFDKCGLSAADYGLFCHDKWDASPALYDRDGETLMQEAQDAGDRYSLRYEEALCMEAAFQRRKAERLESRIAALEERLAAMEARLTTHNL